MQVPNGAEWGEGENERRREGGMEERVRELRIPKGALVLLVGAAGCGQSTWARRHFRAAEVVSSDECRRLVSDDEGDQTVNGLAFPVFHAIIRGRLALGRLAVADSTNLHPHARERLREIAARWWPCSSTSPCTSAWSAPAAGRAWCRRR